MPEFEGAQFDDKLYGALWVALTQVSMAGEAKDDPVPLIGAAQWLLGLTSADAVGR